MFKYITFSKTISYLCFAIICQASLPPSVQADGYKKFVRTEADGTKHITAVKIPVPDTVSTEAQKFLATPFPDEINPELVAKGEMTFAEFVAANNRWIKRYDKQNLAAYAVHVKEDNIGGVRVDIVTPVDGVADHNNKRVLMNLHGGGGLFGAGSVTEAVPVAALGRIKVISVDYRLKPEHPFPAAVDDAIAVYKALLKHYSPESIGIYGASAGGELAAQTTASIIQLGLPLPGAVGVLTNGAGAPFGDAAHVMMPLMGFDFDEPQFPPVSDVSPEDVNVLEKPYYSPELLRQFPDTLLISGTRDGALSATVLLHRALRREGVDAELNVWEAMPHAHWYYPELPEAREANQVIADYFIERLEP